MSDAGAAGKNETSGVGPDKKRRLVRRDLVSVKAFYFLSLGGSGCLIPFLPIFMKQLGLSATEVGVIYGPLPLVNLVLCSAVGALADKIQRHKLILVLWSMLLCLFLGLLLVVPAKTDSNGTAIVFCNRSFRLNDTAVCGYGFVPPSTRFNVTFNDSRYINSTDDCEISLKHFIDTHGRIITRKPECIVPGQDVLPNCAEEVTRQSYCVIALDDVRGVEVTDEFGQTFWMCLVFVIMGMVAFLQANALIDTIAYCILDTERGLWGRQRLFGSLGYGIFTVVATVIMDARAHRDGEVDYSAMIYIFIAVILMSAGVALAIPVPTKIEPKEMFTDIKRLLSNVVTISFFIICFFFGIYIGAIESFLFWFLTDLQTRTNGHHHHQIILGLCVGLNCMAELAVFPVAGKLIARLGNLTCLYLVGLAYFIRFLSYSLMTNAWIALAVEPLHGFTFGLMSAAASSYASLIAPEGLEATSQGLYNGMFNGLGRGTGSLITGALFGILGDHWTFGVYAVSVIVVIVVFWAVQACHTRCTRDSDPEKRPILRKKPQE